MPGRRFLVIYLAHALSVIYVCLCSSAALFSISAHFSWPLSFSALCVAPWTGHLLSCLAPAPLPGTEIPSFTRATCCGSALSPVSQTSSGMCLRLHEPCVGLATAGSAGVVGRAGQGGTGMGCNRGCLGSLQRVRFLALCPCCPPCSAWGDSEGALPWVRWT